MKKMRFSIVLALILAFACQTQNKSNDQAEIASETTVKSEQAAKSLPSKSEGNLAVENEPCMRKYAFNCGIIIRQINHLKSLWLIMYRLQDFNVIYQVWEFLMPMVGC